MKMPLLIGALAVVVLGLSAWIAIPRIKKQVTSTHLAWDAEGASFSVVGFIPRQQSDIPEIVIVCQWDKPPSPWNRFRLDFPGSKVQIGPAYYTAGISPMQNGRFQINYYFQNPPGFFRRMDIPVHCWDATTQRDLGLRMLSLRYWPYQYKDLIQFYQM